MRVQREIASIYVPSEQWSDFGCDAELHLLSHCGLGRAREWAGLML